MSEERMRSNGRKYTKRSPEEIALLTQQAMGLKLAGATFEQIGQKMKVPPQTVHLWIKKAREKAIIQSGDAYLKEHLERLDALQVAQWGAATTGDGFAQDRVLKIMQERARILGLYEREHVDENSDVRKALADFLAGAQAMADIQARNDGAPEPVQATAPMPDMPQF